MNLEILEHAVSQNELSPEEKVKVSKEYSKIHRILSVTGTIIFFAVLLILIFTGLSKNIESIAFGFTDNKYLALLIFLGIIGIGEGIINFPLNFYSDYILEHKYNLSNQTLSKYFLEKIKGFALGMVLGVP